MSIASDGTVTIVAHRSEMGCGSRTALPLVVADELDADWSKVKIEQAIGDPKYGDQDTDGSHSVRSTFDLMRQVGATGRVMLISAAATQWGVSPKDCTTEPHFVVHQPSGRKLGYGEARGGRGQTAGSEERRRASSRSARSGATSAKKAIPCSTLPEIVTGKAIFGMDATMPGMVYASIEHPPVLGQKIKSYDDKAALKVPGRSENPDHRHCLNRPISFKPLGGVAVIADNTWAAFQGRKSAEDRVGQQPAFDVQLRTVFRKTLEETSRQAGQGGAQRRRCGCRFRRSGGKIIEAEYYTPHLAHASMEPPVAVAEYRDGKVLAWAPTQNPQAVQETIAGVLGIKKEDVTCHVTLLGGGFGRKSKPDQVAEAAVLSKQLGKPVKVVWTREDDIHFDFFHSVAAMYMKAARRRRMASRPHGCSARYIRRSVRLLTHPLYTRMTKWAWAGTIFLSIFPNHRAENGPADYHVRIGWLRSVANIYHAFAIHSFADELAHACRTKIRSQYLLDLIGPPRIVKLDLQGRRSRGRQEPTRSIRPDCGAWSRWLPRNPAGASRPMGKGTRPGHRRAPQLPDLCCDRGRSRSRQQGPSAHSECLDRGRCGNGGQPRQCSQPVRGRSVFGTSLALFGEITATNGAIDQSNFNNYQITRMNRAPRHIDVHIVKSDAPPAGVGEPGVPPFAPALYNAVFAATGKRVRELPLVEDETGIASIESAFTKTKPGLNVLPRLLLFVIAGSKASTNF